MKKEFYIFRHGQTSYNIAGRTQGQTNDSVLTPLGQQQAKDIGRRLKDKKIEVIYSSPLTRAQQTASLANLTLHVPILEDIRFTEVNVGEIEGMHYLDIQRCFGEKYQQWRSLNLQFENLRFKGGESKKEVRERVFLALNDYALNSPYHIIAISSHGIMLTQLLLSLGQECSEIPNGAILHLTYDEKKWRINGFI